VQPRPAGKQFNGRALPWLEYLAPGRPWSVPLHVLRRQ
jgi:hypothetical protein